MNEWHTLREASDELCSVVSRCLIMTEGSPPKGNLVGNLYPPANVMRHPRYLLGEWPEMGKACGLNFPFLVIFSWSLWPFVIASGIRTVNLICQIINFQGTCDPCCCYVLLLRHQVWKCLALQGWKLTRAHLGARQSLAPRLSLRLEVTLLAACHRARDLKVNLCHGCASHICG